MGFYVALNTVQVISQRVVGRAEETSTYSLSGFCTVNCRPTASNYQLSHLMPCWEPNLGLRGGRRECYHSATMAPTSPFKDIAVIHLALLQLYLLAVPLPRHKVLPQIILNADPEQWRQSSDGGSPELVDIIENRVIEREQVLHLYL